MVEDQFNASRGAGFPLASWPPALKTAVCPAGTRAVWGVSVMRASVPGMMSVTLSIHAVIDASSHPVRLSHRETARVNDPVPSKATSPLISRSRDRFPATGVSDHSTVFPIVTSRNGTTFNDDVVSTSKTRRSEFGPLPVGVDFAKLWATLALSGKLLEVNKTMSSTLA